MFQRAGDFIRKRPCKHWGAACYGKTAYNSKGAAIERIKQALKRRRFRGKGSKGAHAGKILAPYRCPHCHHWHVGSTDRDDAAAGHDWN